MNYFDTSALVKRFVEEPGSRRVEALIAAQAQVATSKIAYAELHAALARKLRERKLTHAAYRRISGRFELDWHAYIRVELTDALLELTRETRAAASLARLRRDSPGCGDTLTGSTE